MKNRNIGISKKRGGGGAGSIAYSKVSEVTVGGITQGDLVAPTVQDALDLLLSAPYIAPTLSSLSFGITTVELGYKLTGLKSFSFTKSEGGSKGLFLPNTLKIKQNTTEIANSLPITSPQNATVIDTINNVATSLTMSIEATDEKNNTISANNTMSWVQEIWQGVAPDVPLINITEAWVKANLTRTLTNTHLSSLTGNVGVGQRLYYIYPPSFGIKLFNTPIGAESLSNISTTGLTIKTQSQIDNSLAGKDFAINKNEQSNIGNITYTLVNP